MGICRRIVKLHGLRRIPSTTRERLRVWKIPVVAQNAVAVGYSCMGEGVVRAQPDCVLELLDRLQEALFLPLIPIVPSLPVARVRSRPFRRSLSESLPLAS